MYLLSPESFSLYSIPSSAGAAADADADGGGVAA